MNQRLHERIHVELEASVIDLTLEGKSEGCRVLDVSRGGVCIQLPAPVPLGNVVRVDCVEGSFFGQVIHSTADASGFRIGVEVFNVLMGSSDLARLIERTVSQAKALQAVS